MLDPEAQTEVLRRVAEAAARHGLIVAPVGSVFFLFQGRAYLTTKDIDVVAHLEDGSIAPLDLLVKVGKELGDAKPAGDRASVVVSMDGPTGPATVDLLRGKEGAKKSFLPRELLRRAATHGRREGNILWYPIEFVILLKADAAVDKQHRAESGGQFAEQNRQRAEVFKQDAYSQVQSALAKRGAAFREAAFGEAPWAASAAPAGLREDYLVEGLLCLKKARRLEVAALIEAASGGRLRLTDRVRG